MDEDSYVTKNKLGNDYHKWLDDFIWENAWVNEYIDNWILEKMKEFLTELLSE